MLYYRNPLYDNLLFDKDNNVFEFRKRDWKQIIPSIKQFFNKIITRNPKIKIKDIEERSMISPSRNIIEDTLLDKKLKITLEYENKKGKILDHAFTFVIPYMDSSCKLLVNGVRRFLVFQLTDMSVARRKNQIRLNNNLRQIVIHILREDDNQELKGYNYNINYLQTEIPLVLILLYMGDWNIIEKITSTNISVNESNLQNANVLSDIINVEYSSKTTKYYRWLFDDLGKVKFDKEIYSVSGNIKDYLLKYVEVICSPNQNFLEYLDEIIDLDIYFERYLYSSLEEDILNLMNLSKHAVSEIDLRFKRIRLSEYIVAYVMQTIYTQFYKHVHTIKSMNRNFNIQELLPGKKFQEMFQLSKLEDNLVGDITEMLKVTLTGPGGIPADSISTADRNIHNSYYGILDPIYTPDGEKCGVVNYLTLTCPLNTDGTFNFEAIKNKK